MVITIFQNPHSAEPVSIAKHLKKTIKWNTYTLVILGSAFSNQDHFCEHNIS